MATNASDERRLRVGDGVFDPLSGELSVRGGIVRLRPRSAALLLHLVQHSDRVVTREELMEAVWPDVVVTDESISQCVKEIRHALGDTGRDWIRTIPRQGYAFVGTPLQAAPGVAQPAASPANSPPPWRTLLRPGRRHLVIALALTLVLGGFLAREWAMKAPASTPARLLSVVVLPIANLTGDPGHDRTVEELTETLSDRLAIASGLAVVAPSSARSFRAGQADPRRVGEALGVRYVLEGSLRAGQAGPVLRMRLVEAASAMQLWNEEYQRSSIDELRALVPSQVARTFAHQLTHAEARGTSPPSPQAVELLNQARTLYETSPKSRADVAQARALLERAVHLDAELAGAWRLLAVTCLENVRFSPTREADLRRAGEAVARAIALAPDAGMVRMTEGRVYSEQGRQREALIAYRRAQELDPLGPVAFAWEADALIMLGRPQEALQPLAHALELDPRHSFAPVVHLLIGIADVQLGDPESALEPLTRAAERIPQNPWVHLYLASALANAGREAQARREMSTLLQLLPGLTLSRFRALELSDEPEFLQQRRHLYAGLLRAGLPE